MIDRWARRAALEQPHARRVHHDVLLDHLSTFLWQMGRNVGLTDAQMDTVRPVPLVEVAFHVWENLARTRHWIAGWLATSVDEFILTAMPGRHNFRAEDWKRAFGLNDEQVFFFTYHTKADDDHAGRKVWEPITRYLTNDKDRREVFDGMALAITALKLFYQGICELGDQLD